MTDVEPRRRRAPAPEPMLDRDEPNIEAETDAPPRRRRFPQWVPPALLVAAALGVWEVWVAVRHVEPYVLPTPARVARAGWDSAYLLPGHLITTITESLVGLVIGAVVGVALAVVIVRLPLARRVLYPVLVISQTVPMVVLAPLLLIWFGFGLTPKVVVVALIVFFPVLVSTVSGIDGADRDLVDLVRSMGAGPRQVLLLVLVPSAVPAFFAGLRIAAAYTVGGAVIAEYMGGSSGLGVFINRSHSSYNVDRIFVAVVIIGVLTAALFAAVDVAARWAAPWQEPDRPHRRFVARRTVALGRVRRTPPADRPHPPSEIS